MTITVDSDPIHQTGLTAKNNPSIGRIIEIIMFFSIQKYFTIGT